MVTFCCIEMYLYHFYPYSSFKFILNISNHITLHCLCKMKGRWYNSKTIISNRLPLPRISLVYILRTFQYYAKHMPVVVGAFNYDNFL